MQSSSCSLKSLHNILQFVIKRFAAGIALLVTLVPCIAIQSILSVHLRYEWSVHRDIHQEIS